MSLCNHDHNSRSIVPPHIVEMASVYDSLENWIPVRLYDRDVTIATKSDF